METCMRILLKIVMISLLLALIIAVGTEVAALHRDVLVSPRPDTAAAPVVVRKAAHSDIPPKTVCPAPSTVGGEIPVPHN